MNVDFVEPVNFDSLTLQIRNSVIFEPADGLYQVA